ncbi:hypothetical protein HY501_00505 [Candidatus Woesearchaeota archaeon]|nr:hypothetical protein [Candidatus Woesearchaeota archaeon]
MGIYLVNCDTQENLNLFRKKGFVGVKPRKPSDNLKSRQATLRDNYNIVVQLQALKPQDLLFLYAEGRIYGAYRAETRFMEHPLTPAEYQCRNLRFSFPEPCWRTLPTFSVPDFFWQIGISAVKEKCFEQGYATEEKFSLRNREKQWHLPGRFDFEGEWLLSKLTAEEARELVFLLEKENAGNRIRKEAPAKRLKNFKRLRLEITADKYGYLEDEKILESWLIEHSAFHGFNLRNYRNVRGALGKSFNPDSNIPSFYLEVLEALPFVTDHGNHSLQIIDIKRGFLDGKSCIPLLRKAIKYMHEVAANLCQNDLKKVHVTLISKGFHASYFNYLSFRKEIEPGNAIRLVKYDIVGRKIVLTRIN